MALAAYFDDSREYVDGVGLHVLAGYLAPLELWEQQFAPRWLRLIESAPHRISEFKTSDCRACTNEFEGWTHDEATAFTARVVSELAERRYALMFGVGTVIAVPQSSDDALAKRIEQRALGLCLINAIGAMCAYARSVGKHESIHFICDTQPGSQGMLSDLWASVLERTGNWYGKDLSQLDFEDSKKLPPLQAADLLAYETRKELKSRMEQPPRRMSTALQRLLASHPHIGLYCDTDILRELEEADKTGTKWKGPGVLYQVGIVPDPALRVVDDPRSKPS
jgi:hypothetical protein